ncbi:MAG: UDP-glucose/GDP-mannose dehydrogenase family protein [Verrucomicrobia bacterium]|nr:UDP-glucose/GDP-mannose dehydrogenase family protein [Verrucomicrobiota bacterium]
MQILMIGTGYVGLVTASCFAEMGHNVTCLDIDKDKIEKLKQGIIPFFEPGLKEIVDRNVQASRLHFTTSYAQGVSESTVCFIAVPTPSRDDGSCDLSYVHAAAKAIADQMDGYRLIVNKSTVPVGTADEVIKTVSSALSERGCSFPFDVVSNPEFLKEGSAVQDCMKPDRVILGTETSQALELMREIYSAFTLNHDRILTMDVRSAEMTKYAANAMLATRISFMNELAALCEKVGANISSVRVGIGSDARIGYQFLYAGIGYGGSCFPKDIQALRATAQQVDIAMPILNAVETINKRQRRLFIDKILSHYTTQGGVKDKTFAVWGLSFKPDTDDMRDAPSLSIINALLAEGARVRLYDPVAMPRAKKQLPSSSEIAYCSDEYEAAETADGIILVTEWKQFRFVNFEKICPKLNQRVFFDGRNQYKAKEMHAKGFHYYGVGYSPKGQSLQESLAALNLSPMEKSLVH